jgi:LysR family glycine cleavage system transcriptional activator
MPSLPLNAIRAFEAVCRCGSIQRAAEELGVVRGAVRQQISLLEQHFGHKLFLRTGRNIVPTAEAKAFAEAATTALALLRDAAEVFHGESHRTVRLGVPSALCIWWLMPRLGRLQQALGSFQLDIIPMVIADPLTIHPELDAVIMGAEYRPTTGVVAFRFMEDEFGPVAVPSLSKAIESDAAALTQVTMLASRSAPTLWADWFSESHRFPVTFERRQEFEDLLLAISAARSGIGIVLAPRASVAGDINDNILSAPFGFTRRPAGYHLCYRASGSRKPALKALRDWLTAEGGSE